MTDILESNEGQIEQARADLIRKYGDLPSIPALDSWNKIVQFNMIRQNLTLATAESCTGGYIASQITDIPGSSAYFLGSVVSYSNSVKQNVLGVSAETLINYGAVSSQCAGEMLAGVLDVIGSDIGIAVTGIAGPDGGTPEKPVGTVFVCIGNRERKESVRLFCVKSRTEIVRYTYQQCMSLLHRFLST